MSEDSYYAVRLNGYHTDPNGYLLFIQSSGRQYCSACGCERNVKDVSYSVTNNTLNERARCAWRNIEFWNDNATEEEGVCNRKLRTFRKSHIVKKKGGEWVSASLKKAFGRHSREFARALSIPMQEFDLKRLEGTVNNQAIYDNLESTTFDRRNNPPPKKSVLKDVLRTREWRPAQESDIHQLDGIYQNYMQGIRESGLLGEPVSIEVPQRPPTVQTRITDPWESNRNPIEYPTQTYPPSDLAQVQIPMHPDAYYTPNDFDTRHIPVNQVNRMESRCANCGSNPSVFTLQPHSPYYCCNTCGQHYHRDQLLSSS